MCSDSISDFLTDKSSKWNMEKWKISMSEMFLVWKKACVRLFMGKQGRNNRKRVMRDKDWNLTKPMHAKTEWIWMRTYHAYLTYDFIQSFLRILNIFPHTVDPRSFLNNPGCLVLSEIEGHPCPIFRDQTTGRSRTPHMEKTQNLSIQLWSWC